MWTIIKVDPNKVQILTNELRSKLGQGLKVYSPKISVDILRNKKIIKKNINILGDYIFCFHQKFENCNIINYLKFTKGLKYFLNGWLESQTEIKNFIENFKNMENSNGYIAKNFYNLKINHLYKISSGPLTNKIVKLIEIQKNKIKCLFNKIEVNIKTNETLISPV